MVLVTPLSEKAYVLENKSKIKLFSLNFADVAPSQREASGEKNVRRDFLFFRNIDQ